MKVESRNTIKPLMSGNVVHIITRPWPGIGDACYCALLARELKLRFPNGKVICYSNWPELFKYDPNIAEAHNVDAAHLINPILPKRWKEHNGHISENMCLAMGYDLIGSIRIPYYLSEEERTWAQMVFQKEKTGIVIHARQRKKFGSNKDWPMEKWNSLVKIIDVPVLQVGPDSEPCVQGALNYRGLDIRKSIALVALSKVFITCDSGLYHVTSGFIEKKNVVLLGERSHPAHFTYPGDIVLTGTYNCRKKYCDEAQCPLSGNKDYAPCICTISSEEVGEAAKKIMQEKV